MNLLQTRVLTELGKVSHVVQLLGHERISGFQNHTWHAILIAPYGRLLDATDTVRMYKQATFDIAAAIKGSFAKGIWHQDVSLFNMVVYQCRVSLTDWSAGRVT